MAKKQSNILRVKLVKSGIGYSVRTKRTLKALGFHNLNQVVEHEDNEALRGMLTKVSHFNCRSCQTLRRSKHAIYMISNQTKAQRKRASV